MSEIDYEKPEKPFSVTVMGVFMVLNIVASVFSIGAAIFFGVLNQNGGLLAGYFCGLALGALIVGAALSGIRTLIISNIETAHHCRVMAEILRAQHEAKTPKNTTAPSAESYPAYKV